MDLNGINKYSPILNPAPPVQCPQHFAFICQGDASTLTEFQRQLESLV